MKNESYFAHSGCRRSKASDGPRLELSVELSLHRPRVVDYSGEATH